MKSMCLCGDECYQDAFKVGWINGFDCLSWMVIEIDQGRRQAGLLLNITVHFKLEEISFDLRLKK